MIPPFIDTNIAVYAVGVDLKRTLARRILAEPFQLSVQTLNEFALAARRKLAHDWAETNLALDELKLLAAAIHPVTRASHEEAMRLAERHGFHIYDANQIAVALASGAEVMLSEDMQHGMAIAGQLTIVNPFI